MRFFRWNENKLPSMIRGDQQHAARNPGVPVPESAPRIEIAQRPHESRSEILRLPPRRRIISGRATRIAILCLGATAMLGCSDENDARQAVEMLGWSDVHVREDGVDLFTQCGRDDWSAYDVTGTNVAGRKVSGVVCCGGFTKGCTIRSTK